MYLICLEAFLPGPLLGGCEYLLLPETVGPVVLGTLLMLLKRNLNISRICVSDRCLCTLCSVVWTSCFTSQMGFLLNGRGHMVMPFLHVVCQHPVEQRNFYLICPTLCLGVDIGFLGLEGLRRSLLFSEDGTDFYLSYTP